MKRLIIVLLTAMFSQLALGQSLFEVTKGMVNFHSDAPQELIKASSPNITGILDIDKHNFAFRIRIISFIGFNSPLQREHFNENYMESSRFPEASFSGKIIEDADLHKDGTYTVRAKGKLNIHGIQVERIIPVRIKVKHGTMSIESDFVVSLADHGIKIPRVVDEKLAPDINVSVAATLMQRN